MAAPPPHAHSARLTWVGENVGVAEAHQLSGEGPVLLGGACVMVVDEGDSARGPPAEQTRCLALKEQVVRGEAVCRQRFA